MKVREKIEAIDAKVASAYELIERMSLANHQKVLRAFNTCSVSEYHLKGTSGYGYSDAGREVIEKIYCELFKTEAALVRGQITTGTHAISLGLYGSLKAGDELVSITGAPYDTLLQVIGIRGSSHASLKSLGVSYKQVELLPDGNFDFESIKKIISQKTKMVFLQRSRGYAWRSSLTIKDIEKVCQFIKELNHETIIYVDNCYGEMVEEMEPTEVGCDMVAGSLIKNLGGGLAPTGGYIAGPAKLIENAAERMTVPGIGSAVGATMDWNRWFLQGLFMAPHIVAQALKGAIFAAALFEELGFEVCPRWDEYRSDLIQAIKLNSAEAMVKFCQALQQCSPIDSHLVPEPWAMPGYDCEVIMAGGTFVQGSTIELSADGPLREPFAIYLQGGLSLNYVKIAVCRAAANILGNNITD